MIHRISKVFIKSGADSRKLNFYWVSLTWLSHRDRGLAIGIVQLKFVYTCMGGTSWALSLSLNVNILISTPFPYELIIRFIHSVFKILYCCLLPVFVCSYYLHRNIKALKTQLITYESFYLKST